MSDAAIVLDVPGDALPADWRTRLLPTEQWEADDHVVRILALDADMSAAAATLARLGVDLREHPRVAGRVARTHDLLSLRRPLARRSASDA